MKKYKISIFINIVIASLVMLGTILMFTGFKFMPSKTLLTSTKIEMFKFFTVDSNIFMGIVAIIFIIYQIRLLNKKTDKIPKSIRLLKMMSTSSVTLTFLVTLFFLVPQYGLYQMYNNSNLFFHLLVPVLAIISYILFEDNNIKYKEVIYGIIPMFLYSVFYISNISIHLNNDGLTYKYDFYGFLGGNINNIFIVLPIMYLIAYLISLLLVFFNKKSILINRK